MNWAEAFFYSVAAVCVVISVGFLTGRVQIVVVREEGEDQ